MTRLGGRAPATAIAVASVVVLVGAVLAGLRVPGTGFLPPFPSAGALDYSSGPPGGFAPLDEGLVARLLGMSAGARPDETSDGGPGSRPGGSGVSAVATRPVTVDHVFTNDHFAAPYRIPSVPFTARTNTSNATREAGEPGTCGPLGGRSAWYAYTATRDVGLLADTLGSAYGTALTVYTGAEVGRLQRVSECSSDARGNAVVAFPARAGTSYYFQIDGLGGDLVFTLQEQGVTTLASVDSDGRQSEGDSFMGALSTNANRVLMASGGSAFDDDRDVPCAPTRGAIIIPCGKLGVYHRDRVKHRMSNFYPEQSAAVGETDLASVAAPGAVTPDGRYIGFFATVEAHAPDPDGATPSSPYRFEVFRRDMTTRVIERVSVPCPGCGEEADGSSGRVEMSDDGRYVAFVSWATNLVPGDDNDVRDVFVRDMKTRTTTRVSVASDADQKVLGLPNGAESFAKDKGSDLFSISRDGRFVSFRSSSSNLVHGDTNGWTDVFLRDRVKGTTTRVNLSSDGQQAQGETRTPLALGLHTMSDDGRYVYFASEATNLVNPPTNNTVEHVYRRDLRTRETILVSVSSTGVRANKSVASEVTDPRRLAFTHLAPIVIAGGPTVTISPLSYSTTADGRFVAFNSDADNLVPGDTNAFTDVFLHDTLTGTTTRASVSSDGAEAVGGPSGTPSLSGDGRFIAFDSNATNLVRGDENDSVDVFVRELPGHHPFTGWH